MSSGMALGLLIHGLFPSLWGEPHANSILELAAGNGMISVPRSRWGGWAFRRVPGADAGSFPQHQGEAVAHLLDCPPPLSAHLWDPCCHPTLKPAYTDFNLLPSLFSVTEMI